jgi:uncharacterized protein (TIGR03085 family)
VAGVHFDEIEREQLCALLVAVGPHAPTLLAPWTTHDLAAHLVLREHDNVAAPGLVVPGPWARFAERHRVALRATPYDELVATIDAGPPRGFFRIGWVRDFPNLNEYFVHHEDVRRANGRAPRARPAEEDAALFRNVVRARRYLARRLHGAAIELVWAGTDSVVTVGRAQPTVRVSGSPGELLLFLFGRHAAVVEMTGPSDAVAIVERTHFGM